MNLRVTGIHIQNFRSIRDMRIKPAELAVLVGRNDVGKSNVLRALNLFFTGYTSPQLPLDFDNDHNVFHEPNRRAKDFRVTLEISLPDSYRENNGDFVVWEKRWRRESPQPTYESCSGRRVRETRQHTTVADAVEIPHRSRVRGLLRNINYVYVPAIKDTEYFGELRARIYGVLAEAAAKTFHDSSQAFEHSISEHLRDLTEDIRNTLGFESRMALPRDLSHVFESLDFLSADTDISLESRGDGIKARHIPMILKFMADKLHSMQGPGSTPHTFIWGYEEPENSLELASCVELADQLQGYAQNGIAQIFLTTHSPVFYNLSGFTGGVENNISRHHIALDRTQDGSLELTNPSNLDERMGTMTAFAPMVQALETEIRSREAAKRAAEELAAKGRRKLFVEARQTSWYSKKPFVYSRQIVPQKSMSKQNTTVADGTMCLTC